MLSLGLGIRPPVLVCTEASFLPKGLIRREIGQVARSTHIGEGRVGPRAREKASTVNDGRLYL